MELSVCNLTDGRVSSGRDLDLAIGNLDNGLARGGWDGGARGTRGARGLDTRVLDLTVGDLLHLASFQVTRPDILCCRHGMSASKMDSGVGVKVLVPSLDHGMSGAKMGSGIVVKVLVPSLDIGLDLCLILRLVLGLTLGLALGLTLGVGLGLDRIFVWEIFIQKIILLVVPVLFQWLAIVCFAVQGLWDINVPGEDGSRARLDANLDGLALGSPVAIVEVIKVARAALVPGCVARESKVVARADGVAGGGEGIVLGWVIELELEVRRDVSSPLLTVLEHAISERQDQGARSAGARLLLQCQSLCVCAGGSYASHVDIPQQHAWKAQKSSQP